MSNIIQLLPDHLANQIAAGEVIQRPASAVKELVENAVDADATLIQLIIKDAGKELIQVVDNGKGMSPMDARMSFERHATSKIKKIEDLFEIKTKGFRGEALASVAAVAQVIMKTKRLDDVLGTQLEIEASTVTFQEPVASADGTTISIKNLFYNVPARRHFLKSNTTELRHILDEFVRIAMAHPSIAFKFNNNGAEQFNLFGGNLKQRILALMGNNLDKHLIPVNEEAELVNITGFIGKPESASRTRGNQFFFINNRFIKSAYLNHALTAAYDGLITKDSYPTYFLFLEIDPKRIDVNVHPTKQEVKFDDDKTMYAYLHAAVKFALNKHNVAPSIDFSLDASIQNLDAIKMPLNSQRQEEVHKSYLAENFSRAGQAHFIEKQQDRSNWKKQQSAFFPDMPSRGFSSDPTNDFTLPLDSEQLFSSDNSKEGSANSVIQWQKYLITTMKSGIVILHQKRALERIIYETLKRRLQLKDHVSQQLLFPVELSLSPVDALMLSEVVSDLYVLGYDIRPAEQVNVFNIMGVPPDVPSGQEENIIGKVLEDLKNESSNVEDVQRSVMLKSMAKRLAVPTFLLGEQAQHLIDELFACEQPQYTPDGKLIFKIVGQDLLHELL